MQFGFHAGLLVLASAMAGTTLAQASTTMNVLGNVKASFDGEPREWVTLAGEFNGQRGASANWHRLVVKAANPAEGFAAMAEGLPPQQRAQLEALSKQLGQNNPMTEMFSQMAGVSMGGNHINLSITGHDPDSQNILTEQALSLNVDLPGGDAPIGKPVPADITYVLEAAEKSVMPRILYIAGEDGKEPTVTFERLELESGGGHATGSFSATLCRLDMQKLRAGPDLTDCIEAAGTFDTTLVEEEPVEL